MTANAALHVMRHASHTGVAEGAAPNAVREALSEKGQPLDESARNYFEPRFGRDLGGVRVHTGASADASARAVNAHAYTVGRDVVFRAGRYSPSTTSGQRLLAHELTHVVQQAAAPAPSLQRDDAGGGSTTFTELVDSITTNSGSPGVWDGRVTRRELNQAGDTIHTGRAPVHYDENTCSVTVPMTVSFRHATLADVGICPPRWDQPAPTTLPANVSSARLREIADQYLRAMNEDLNNWYKVRLDGCDANPCRGREMPIQVQVTEVSSDADYEVAVVNREGRSCVDNTNYENGSGSGLAVLYATDLSRGTMAHEGGHMVLGHGDEYREQENPTGGEEGRVREDDYSRMGSHPDYGRFVLMHERHFAFVPAFLNRVRPGCNARLVAVERSAPVDFRPSFHMGYAGFPTASGINSGLYLDLGAEIGVPLDRLRDWELILGVHGRMLAELEGDSRLALLLGIRAGLERRFTPSSGGLYLGAYGETGISAFSPTGNSLQSGTYAEGGAYLGYHLGADDSLMFRLEGAMGNIWSSTGRIGDASTPVLSEPDNMEYFRVGLGIVGEF